VVSSPREVEFATDGNYVECPVASNRATRNDFYLFVFTDVLGYSLLYYKLIKGLKEKREEGHLLSDSLTL